MHLTVQPIGDKTAQRVIILSDYKQDIQKWTTEK